MKRKSTGKIAGALVAIVTMVLALFFVGNAAADPNNVTGDDCSWLFPGSVEIPQGDMTWTGGDNQPSVTVWTVDIKWYLAGFVVKGGNGYNKFSAGEANNPMTAPDNASGGAADVSHWFACGMTEVEETTSSETTTTTPVETTTETSETTTETTSETTTDTTTSTTETSDTTTSETTSQTETTTPSETTSQTSESTSASETTPPVTTSDSSSVAPTTTTPVAPVVDPVVTPEVPLAYTGVDLGWLLLIVVGLLAVGGVLAFLARRRKK